MKKYLKLFILVMTWLLAACSSESPTSKVDASGRPMYVTLDRELTRLKADFNAMEDKVRLVFISGPSCGICLRGMDDLNESIVASLQNDPRIHTLVVYVPTLGARERHVVSAVPLMQGPRINHYWDKEGGSGVEFQQALGIPMYAWDVWLMYAPGVRWEPDSAPPAPAFWHHQLPGLPLDLKLDADKFAEEITARLAELSPSSAATKLAVARRSDPGLLSVAQPRGVMIQQNHMSRGGYQNLKAISSIRYDGETEIDGQTYSLKIDTARPHYYKRTVTDGVQDSTVSWNGAEIVRYGQPLGLPVAFQDELLRSFEFDGWMTDWKVKGHQVRYFDQGRLLATERFDHIKVTETNELLQGR